ncbi:TSPAN33, partial [Symbiodinium sp. KB8]
QRSAERAEQRKQRKQAYKSHPVTDPSSNFCLRNSGYILLAVNITFGLLGIGLLAMGIYGTQGSFAALVGKEPGLALAGLGAVTLLVAVVGHLGAKYDNKFILLGYFLIVFAAMVTFAVLGGIVLFNNAEINQSFSEYWCERPATAAQGQKDFNCCGYECPFDRPAEGTCTLPDGTTQSPTNPLTCSAGSGEDLIKAGKERCRNAPDFHGLEGCKTKGVQEMESRVVPLFGLAFATGLALLVGTFVSGYLVCRSTRRGAPAGADESAADANLVLPSDESAPLAASSTFALDMNAPPQGGAAEAK